MVAVWVGATGVFGSLEAYRQLLYRLVVDHPELVEDLPTLLPPVRTQIVTGSIVAPLLSWSLWVSWRWWYARWTAYLRVTPARGARGRTLRAGPFESWQSYQERVHRQYWTEGSAPEDGAVPEAPNRRPLSAPALAGLAATTLLALATLALYEEWASGSVRGAVFVSDDAPRSGAVVSFRDPPSAITLVNTSGFGAIDVTLAKGEGGVVRAVDAMSLSNRTTRTVGRTVDLRGLPPGSYQLNVTLRQGFGGLVRFTAPYGGGPSAWLSSTALGLVSGVWWTLVSVVVLELVASGGWIQD